MTCPPLTRLHSSCQFILYRNTTSVRPKLIVLAQRHKRQRPRVLAICCHAFALIALLAQISLPWLKGWHDAREQQIAFAADCAGEDQHRVAHHFHPEAHADHHDGAACPVCRLIGQSRNALLASTPQQAVGAPTQRAAGAVRSIAPEIFSANTAAPRAPPPLLA